ncbi:CAP domain-containing protein [Oceanobacillus chungangensis]|uniref:Uncharacterized protein n=1 Tax=Oceanobacillus chungangensis TaxID=1229152 RepID=A0A3D8PQV1_9BACI|nr:CAP domain-containing protein [Oceanobacillus chungangensis]RDW17947.1 hypothetical protein CWR45_11485 [Oceanobacillus chungangensis]
MKFIRSLIFITIIAFIAFYILEEKNLLPNDAIDSVGSVAKEKTNTMRNKVPPEYDEKQSELPIEGDLYGWVGGSIERLIDKYGEPIRRDTSAYGYEWWVYTDYQTNYIQFGIKNNQIETIYATGNSLTDERASVGQSFTSLDEKFSFNNEVSFNEGFSTYTFKLTNDELKMRPLVKLNDNVFAQFYFDTFTNQLSSIRVLTADILLKHRPYQLHYRGDLPEEPHLTVGEWEKIEAGMEQQVFDITNVFRDQQGLEPLQWDVPVAEVAFSHSKDMEENNYFSHDSLNGDGLKERLAVEEVIYVAAGENIAAEYTDAPAAMEGWLNSEGHREALFNKEYTHLGVGVYKLYYTQNFLAKPL